MKDGPSGVQRTAGTTYEPPVGQPVAANDPATVTLPDVTPGAAQEPAAQVAVTEGISQRTTFDPVGGFPAANPAVGPLPEISSRPLRTRAQAMDRALDQAIAREPRSPREALQQLETLKSEYARWQAARRGQPEGATTQALDARFASKIAGLIHRATAMLARSAGEPLPRDATSGQRLSQLADQVQALTARAGDLGGTPDLTAVRHAAQPLIQQAYADILTTGQNLAAAERLPGQPVEGFLRDREALATSLSRLGMSLTPEAEQGLTGTVAAVMQHRGDRLVDWGVGLAAGGVTADELTEFQGSARTYRRHLDQAGLPPAEGTPQAESAAQVDRTGVYLTRQRIATLNADLNRWVSGEGGSLNDLRRLAQQLRTLRGQVHDADSRAALRQLEENFRTVVATAIEGTGIMAGDPPRVGRDALGQASALVQIAGENGIRLPSAVAGTIMSRLDAASRQVVSDSVDTAVDLFVGLYAQFTAGVQGDMSAREAMRPMLAQILTALNDDSHPLHGIVSEAMQDPQGRAAVNAAILVLAGDSFRNVDRAIRELGVDGFNQLSAVLTTESNLEAIRNGSPEAATTGSIFRSMDRAVGEFEMAAGRLQGTLDARRAHPIIGGFMSLIGTSTSTFRNTRDDYLRTARQAYGQMLESLRAGRFEEFEDRVRTTAAMGRIADSNAYRMWDGDIQRAESVVTALEVIKTSADVASIALGAGALVGVARVAGTAALRGGLMVAARNPAVLRLAAAEGGEAVAATMTRREIASLAAQRLGTSASEWAASNLPRLTSLGSRFASSTAGAATLRAGAWLTGTGGAHVSMARGLIGDAAFGALMFTQVDPQTGDVSLSARDQNGDLRWGAIGMAALPIALRGGTALVGRLRPVPPPEAPPVRVSEPAVRTGGGAEPPAAAPRAGEPPASAPRTGEPPAGGPRAAESPAAPQAGEPGAAAASARPARQLEMFLEDAAEELGRTARVGDEIRIRGQAHRVARIEGEMAYLEPVGSASPVASSQPVAEVAVRPGSPNAGSEAGSLGDQIYQNVQRLWSRPIPEPARAGLQPRWQAIEQEAAALRNRRTTAPNDPALQAADEAMARQRMSASGTVRGEARPGDGVRGASTAETNFRRTDEMVRQWVAQGEPITVERIAQINESLGRGLANNGHPPGVMRGTGLDVAAGMTRPYVFGQDVPRAMDDFVQWYARASAGVPPGSPIELAAEAYQRLVSIHPFPDANGRTCRMVMDWILQQHGLPPATLVGNEVNVAVFGMDEILGITGGVSPEHAVQSVTQGVERSLEIMRGAGN